MVGIQVIFFLIILITVLFPCWIQIDPLFIFYSYSLRFFTLISIYFFVFWDFSLKIIIIRRRIFVFDSFCGLYFSLISFESNWAVISTSVINNQFFYSIFSDIKMISLVWFSKLFNFKSILSFSHDSYLWKEMVCLIYLIITFNY